MASIDTAAGGNGAGARAAGGGRLPEVPAPVRPAWTRVEAAVRALTLPGARRTSAERERARGWADRALFTIEALRLHVLTPDMPEYPDRLRHLADPPDALFARGRLDLLDGPVVAIVGTRSCTAYGRESARRLAGGLAAAGVPVLSGLARGIDGVAHLAAGPARTIAVVGNGVDVVYPRSHADLQAAIGRHGLLLSEQVPGSPPLAHAFPRRNRILAALAAAVVVVEAPHRSGALITARLALDLGRTVFAVPGPIDARASAGTNALIGDGARLVTSAREVLNVLGLPSPDPAVDGEAEPAELYGVGLALWRVLGTEPRHVDAIAADLGLDPHQILASLLSLEVLGHARQLVGLRFVRV